MSDDKTALILAAEKNADIVAAAMAALDGMAEAWAERTGLVETTRKALEEPVTLRRLDKLVALAKLAYAEGLYNGRTSHTDQSTRRAVGDLVAEGHRFLWVWFRSERKPRLCQVQDGGALVDHYGVWVPVAQVAERPAQAVSLPVVK